MHAEQLMALAMQQAQPQRERQQRRHERPAATLAPVPDGQQQGFASAMEQRNVQQWYTQRCPSTVQQTSNVASACKPWAEQRSQEQQLCACSTGAMPAIAAAAYAAPEAELASCQAACSPGLYASCKRKAMAMGASERSPDMPVKRLAAALPPHLVPVPLQGLL